MPRHYIAKFVTAASLFLSGGALIAQPETIPMVVHNFQFSQFDAFGYQAPNTVHSVHTDKKGRLWIGSESGLQLFDGNGITSFQGKGDNPGDIPHYFAKSIAESPDGTIWVGTWGGGFVHFNEATRSFEKPIFDSENVATQEALDAFDGKTWSLKTDLDGNLWIGSFTSGLFRYSPGSKQFVQVFKAEGDLARLQNRIESIHIDSDNRVWFSPSGLNTLVVEAGTLSKVLEVNPPDHLNTHPSLRLVADIEPIPNSTNLVIAYNRKTIRTVSQHGDVANEIVLDGMPEQESIMEVLPLNQRDILIGSGYQLWYANLESGEHFSIPGGTWPGAIPKTIIWDMDIAPNGDLLVAGTTGVWIQPESSRQFWTITADGNDPSHLHEARAINFSNSTLYINNGSRLYELDNFPVSLKEPQVVSARIFLDKSNHRALSLIGDHNIGFWAGSESEVFYIDPNGQWSYLEGDVHSVHILKHDKDHERILTPALNGLRPISINNPTVAESIDHNDASRTVITIAFGAHEDIWTGTFSGFHRYDRETLQPLNEFSTDAAQAEWSEPFTNFIHILDDESLFIGSSDGLFKAITNNEGEITNIRKLFRGTVLDNAGFTAVFEISERNFIVASNRGMARVSPYDESFQLLPGERVGPVLSAYGGSYWQVGNTAILSGINGPLLFRLDDLQLDYDMPELIISDIVSFRGDTTTPWEIDNNLQFEYEDKVVRFKFGLLDYLEPEDNLYRIRLEGFTDDWLEIDTLNEFSFTNLNSGQYTLHIEGRDGGSAETSSAVMSFNVLPPWWQTWWAYTLYTFIILGSLLSYFTHLRRKLLREQEISAKLREADTLKSRFLSELEIKVDEATSDLKHAVEALEIKNVELEVAQQRAQDASRLKSEFLANMSHEIRTPMNGVLGFTQLLKKSQLDADQVEYVNTIDNSAHNLLSIINDILDISRIEAGKLIIDHTGYELRNCATEMLETLAPVAYEKNLDLVMEIASDLPLGLRGDPVRMRQVMTNLVGNAIKFTDTGHVSILLRTGLLHGEDALEIVIEDTGRGISETDRERLFQAFERGATDVSKSVVGTGLGLVITKKLTEAMGGEINLDSKPGEGTRVTLLFPLQPDRNPENRYDNIQPLAGKQVHLVDANETSRAALHEMLLHLGAEILSSAEFDTSLAQRADIVACTLAREDIDKADEQLAAMRRKIGEGKPLISFVSSMDRIRIRELGEMHSALCVPRIVQLPTLVRRIEDWLRGGTNTVARSTASPASGMMSGMDVIIADDNRINRFFLKKMLETHGASVHEATDGREALDLLTNETINAELALIDLHMPELSGLELAERARAAGVSIPLLVVSANVLPETRKAATAAGFDGYILKPVEEDVLVDTVRRYCRREVVE